MLSKICTAAAAVLALSLAAPGSLSQAASPTQFSLKKLEQSPGTILISPGYVTIIEFSEDAVGTLSGNQKLFQIAPRKSVTNLLAMTAVKSAGQTDLLVKTEGKIAMFVVKIDPLGKAPRRYTVTGANGAAASIAAPPRPVAPVAPAIPASPALRPAITGAAAAARYEAEAAILYRANPISSSQASGRAVVEHINRVGSRVTFPAVRAARSGTYTLRIHYTNGYAGQAIQTLLVNGLAAPDVLYPPTGTWDTLRSVDVPVTLRAGLNNLRFTRQAGPGQGESVVTLDVIEVLPAGSVPAVQAQAAVVQSAPVQSAPVQSAPVSPGSGAVSTRQAIAVPNSGFESGLVGWEPWQSQTGMAGQSTGNKQPHAGSNYLVLSNKVPTLPLKQNMSQTITGLKSGTYTLEAWIRTSGGQIGLALYAKDYGGKELILAVPTTANATWARYSLPGIAVTNGKVMFGAWSNAPAGDIWVHVDDMALYREADQP